MSEHAKKEARERFELEDSEVRSRVRSTGLIQNIIWLISTGIGLALLGRVAMEHIQNGISLQEIAPEALPAIMITTYVITTGYVIFILLYSRSARAIYHAHSIVHPHLHEHVEEHERPEFKWHSYFRKPGSSRSSGADIIFGIVFKLTTLFALIAYMQLLWLQLHETTGEVITDQEYAYLGGVSITLASCVILFIVVLLAIRIAFLGDRNREHQRARQMHPPADPTRAR